MLCCLPVLSCFSPKGLSTFRHLNKLVAVFALSMLGVSVAAAQVTNPAGYNFGTVALGAAASTTTLTFAFTASVTVGSVTVTTQGATGKDFQAGTQLGTACTAKAYTSGQSCTVVVSFAPLVPGKRLGAAVLRNASNQIVGTGFVTGVGSGAQLGYTAPTVSTFVGTGTYSTTTPVGLSGTSAGLLEPSEIAFDGNGNAYVGDLLANSIYKITPAGLVSIEIGSFRTTCSSTYNCGYPTSNSTLLGSNAKMYSPYAIMVDGAGQLWFSDCSVGALATIDLGTGYVTGQVLGTGAVVGAPATTGNIHSLGAAGLGFVYGLASDGLGDVYVAAYNQGTNAPAYSYSQILKLDSAGNISLFAGAAVDYTKNSGPADGSTATSGSFGYLWGLGIDGSGDLYSLDAARNIIYKFDTSGKVQTFAGTGSIASDNASGLPYWGSGTASSTANTAVNFAKFYGYLAVDPNGNVYYPTGPTRFVDTSSLAARVYVFSAAGTAYVLAGNGTAGEVNGAATSSEVVTPAGVALNGTGDIYFTETYYQNGSSTFIGSSVRKWTMGASTLTFSSQAKGTTSAGRTVTATNIGNAAFTLSAAPSTSPTDFTLLTNSASDACVNNGTFAVGSSCSAIVGFSPHSASGTIAGTLNFAGNVPTGSSVPLSGTAAAGVTSLKFVSLPANVSEGAQQLPLVGALDASNAVVTGYTGTVHFALTNPDPSASVPADYTFTGSGGGQVTFPIAFSVPGAQTVTVTDSANGLTASQSTTVSGPATHFSVTAASPEAVGTSFTVTVQALDVNNLATSAYAGTVKITSSDAAAVLPPNATLTNGLGTFTMTLNTKVATTTVTATDTVTASITGTSSAINVLGPTAYVVTVATDTTAGVAANCPNQNVTPVVAGPNCSLRDAIAAGNAALVQSTITFAPTLTSGGAATITLGTSGVLTITGKVAITGPGVSLLTINGNNASGIYSVSANAVANISGMTLTNGLAGAGGGAGVYNAGNTTVSQVNMTNNTSSTLISVVGGYSAGGGGAVTNATGGTMALSQCNITGTTNALQAFQGGGAIFNFAQMTIDRCAISNNTTRTYFNSGVGGIGILGLYNGTGGGIGNYQYGTLTITNSLISGNQSTNASGPSSYGSGGGIANTGTLYMYSSTVTGNSGSFGGGLSIGISGTGTSFNTVLVNDTITGNTATYGPDIENAGGASIPVTISNSIIGVTPNFNWYSTGGGNLIAVNANLMVLGNYGGPTQSMLPGAGSVAFCAGVVAAVPASVTTDQRGFPRVAGSSTSTTGCLDSGATQTTYVLAFTQQPTLTAPGALITPAPVVQVVLGGVSQPVQGASVTLVATPSSGFSGTTPVVTDVNGNATFSDLKYSGGVTGAKLTGSVQLGTSTIKSNYSLDSNTFNVVANGDTTSLILNTTSSGSIGLGQAVNFTAIVQDTMNYNTMVTGGVIFTDVVGSTTTVLNGGNPVTLNGGVATLNGVILAGDGVHTITASYPGVAGSFNQSNHANLMITVGAATHFSVTAASPQVAGASFPATVAALDANNATATLYAGTVKITSSDSAAVLPANATLTNGVGTFTVTLNTMGSATLTATDTVTGSITGVSSAINVVGPPVFLVTVSTDATTGVAANCPNQSLTPVVAGPNCSLRDALAAAAAVTGGVPVTVNFSPTTFTAATTITELSGALPLPANTTVQGLTSGSGPTLTNLITVSGNNANTVFTATGVSNVVLNNLIITKGNGSLGGGLYISGATVTVNQATISGNTATTVGGGIAVVGPSMTLTNSTVSGNTAPQGAGIYMTSGGSNTVTGSTVSGNTATNSGGGIYVGAYTGLALISDTISNNSATTNAGGLFASGNETLSNSIVEGNTAPTYPNIQGGNGTATFTPDSKSLYSLGTATPPYTAATLGLASLGSYGGPTQTMPAMPGSPALCVATSAGSLTVDQRGYPRVANYSQLTVPCIDSGATQALYSLAFVQQPTNFQVNTKITPAPTVAIYDNGVLTPLNGAPIFMGDTANAITGATSSQATVSGIATFNNLSSTTAATGDKLVALIGINFIFNVNITSNSFNVTAGDNTTVTVGSSSNSIGAGQTLNLTATVKDTTNTGTTPTGSVTFTDMVGATATPLNGGNPVALVNGVAALSGMTLGTDASSSSQDGVHTITASYAGVSGTFVASSNTATVTVGVATHLGVQFSIPGPQIPYGTTIAGFPFQLTVNGLDANNNISIYYNGNIAFTSTDPAVVLPGVDAFVSNNNYFNNVVLNTVGSQTITVTDTANPSITGTTTTITVLPPPVYLVTVNTDTTTGFAANCPNQSLTPVIAGPNCSLRDALTAAANAPYGDYSATVKFAMTTPTTISLSPTNLFLTIPQNTTVQGATSGSGATLTNLITLSGGPSSGNFIQSSGVAVFRQNLGSALNNLILSNISATSALINMGSGKLVINQCAIQGNTQSYFLIENNNGDLTINNSTIANNVMLVGGILNETSGSVTPGTLSMNGNTVTGNSSTYPTGQGAFLVNGGTVTQLIDNTIVGNSTPQGTGGIMSFSPSLAILTGNIIAGNSGDANADISGFTPDATNLFGTSTTGVSNVVPAIAVLGNYGGPTQTMPALPGGNAFCHNISSTLATDQRGYPRISTYGPTSCVDAGATQSAYSLAFVQQPSNVQTGASISPSPTVQLYDHGSATALGGASIGMTAATGTLSGTTSQSTASTGFATFANLSFNAAQSSDKLTATTVLNSSINITATSSTFNVIAVDHFAFSGLPTTATAGVSFTGTVTAYLDKAGTQVATNYTGPITFTSSDAQAVLPMSTILTAGVSGTLNFSLKTAVTQTITVADSSGSPITASGNIVVSPGPANLIAVSGGSVQSATIGAAFTSPLLVKVLDAYGNLISGNVVTFAAPTTGASASLSASTCTTSSTTGTTFGTCSVTATANGIASTIAYTVFARATGVTSGTSFTLTNNAVSPTLTVTTSPTTLVYGQPVTVTATSVPLSAGGSYPTGTATFYGGATAGTTLGAVTSPTNGVSSYNTTAQVGLQTYAASTIADTNFGAVAKTLSTAITVKKATSTLAGPTIQPVQITVATVGGLPFTVTGQYSGTSVSTPSGSIGYTIGAPCAASCTGTATISAGAATISTPTTLAPGPYTVAVTYTGDGNYSAAAGVNVSILVSQLTPTVTYPTQTAITYGTSLANDLNATTAYNLTSLTAGGTTTYTATLLTSGSAIPVTGTTVLAAGSYTLTATWTPNTANAITYKTVTGTTSLIVNKEPLSVVVNTASSVYGVAFPTFTGTLTGVVNSDGITASYSTAATTTSVPGGTYSITATLNDPNSKLANYTVTNTPAGLIIAKATPVVSLMSSASPILLQNTITLTATVSSSSGTPANGDTVTFYDNTSGASLGNGMLTNGVATLPISTLTVGTHNITATFNGDADFTTALSPAISEVVEDFSLNISTASGSVTSVTVLPGGTATYQLVISPTGTVTTFPASVNLTVTGLPAGATYTLTPSTIAAGSGSTPVTLTITVPKQTAMLHNREKLAPIALALLLLPFSRRIRRRAGKLSQVIALVLLLVGGIAGMGALTGCGSTTGFFASPQQTYNVTITGTSGALSHSTTVILTVQ